MPEKTLTVATYAAGASLAAITLFYVFGPTFTLDSNTPPPSSTSNFLGIQSARKKGVVGLANPANDCFINSVLQALAGLGDLRLYLIRETHRRSLDETWVYAVPIPPEARGDHGGRWAQMEDWKIEGLQRGLITHSLKDVLDALNERPIYKKTISAAPFVRSLETAFRQRISRQQQDAQEFLQVVAERLCEEYHAGRKARKFAKQKGALADSLAADKLAKLALEDESQTDQSSGESPSASPTIVVGQEDQPGHETDVEGEEEGFPMEGKQESQIECLTCGFKPQPKESTFCSLTLNVPHTTTTTLNDCFDGMFKTEYIDDFKCEKCRLVHAVSVLETEARKPSTSASLKSQLASDMAKLEAAIEADPEKVPEGVTLPDLALAPKRRIARHTRLTRFPKILAIHLSRSIYDSHMSQKNTAKLSFPERLPLGGLLQQKKYKLLGVVTHKGSHYSGHYESFRRQNAYAPFANLHPFQASGVYSSSAAGSPVSTPRIPALQENKDTSPLASTPDLLSPPATTPAAPAAPVSPAAASATSVSVAQDQQPQTPQTPQSPTPRVSLSSLRHALSPNGTTPSSPSSPTQQPSLRDASHHKDPAETSSIRSVAASALSRMRSSSSRPSSRNGSVGRKGGGGGSGDSSPCPSPSPSSPLETPVAPAAENGNGGAAGATKRPDSVKEDQRNSKRRAKQQQQQDDRWWRISDDRIQQAATRDVLEMKQEVYMLFYEMERQTPV